MGGFEAWQAFLHFYQHIYIPITFNAKRVDVEGHIGVCVIYGYVVIHKLRLQQGRYWCMKPQCYLTNL